MSEVQIWSEVGVDVQSAATTAVAITTISKANPAVASAAAHTFVVGDIVLLRVKGFNDLDYAVVRVKAIAAGVSFTLEDIDTSAYAGTFVSGTASKITFGITAATFTDVTPSGGEADKVAIRTIHTKRDYNLPGNETPLAYAFGSLWDIADPALVALKAASRGRQVVAVRFRFLDGTVVLFAGIPSTNLAPGGAAGAAVTTPVSIDVRGWLQAYPGA
jgi:Phage tail tube protein, TTP